MDSYFYDICGYVVTALFQVFKLNVIFSLTGRYFISYNQNSKLLLILAKSMKRLKYIHKKSQCNMYVNQTLIHHKDIAKSGYGVNIVKIQKMFFFSYFTQKCISCAHICRKATIPVSDTSRTSCLQYRGMT